MYFIFKVGNKYPVGHPLHYKAWRDGQLVTYLPDSATIGTSVRKHFAVIQTPHSLLDLRGSTNIKALTDKSKEFDKLLWVKDSAGRLPWDKFYNEEDTLHKRDYFVDYKQLLESKLIELIVYSDIYDTSKQSKNININLDFSSWIQLETDQPRLDNTLSLYAETHSPISTGTHSIGNALDYDTIALFEADIAATLTGNLTGEHANEETAMAANVTFALDTDGHKLTVTAASGAEHNGGVYGNGARVALANYVTFAINSTTIQSCELSKLAIDATGAYGVYLQDSDHCLFNRLLVYGSTNRTTGINIYGWSTDVLATNNILYDCASGVTIGYESDAYVKIYNNTVVSGVHGINSQRTGQTDTNWIIKNNLVQNCTNDFIDAGSGFGTTAKNVTEDSSGPDAAYDDTDVHTNSVFKNYGADDYRLDSGGDATNLAILDDGDNLSGTFTDDIQGQTRDTWYIGASEIPAGGDTPLACASGAVTVAGTAVSLEADRTLATASGAVGVAGTAVTLAVNRPIVATSGAVTVAGTAVSLEADRTLAIASGAVSVVGTAVGLKHYTLACASGAVGVVGTAVGLFKQKGFAVVSGAVGVAGTAIVLKVNRPIAVASGAVGVAGTAVSLKADRILACASGAVTVAGTAVTLQVTRPIEVASGAVTVAGTAASLEADRVLPIASGAVAVTGTAVSLEADKTLAVASGAVTVAGTVITLLVNRPLIATSGTVSVVGTAVALSSTVLDNKFTIATGVTYDGISRLTVFPTGFGSGTDLFVYLWRDTDVWQYDIDQQAIDNLYFDDNTDDGGHPGGAVLPNQYANHFIWIHPGEGHVYTVYGRETHGTIAAAYTENVPIDVPVILRDFGLYIGRIIIEKNATTFASIRMVTDQ